MNFTGIVENFAGSIADLARSNPLAAAIVLIVLAFLIYRKPKLFLFIFLLGAIIVGALYVVSDLSSSGTARKGGLIEKSTTSEESFRTPLPWL